MSTTTALSRAVEQRDKAIGELAVANGRMACLHAVLVELAKKAESYGQFMLAEDIRRKTREALK